jgi:hypothetical protein
MKVSSVSSLSFILLLSVSHSNADLDPQGGLYNNPLVNDVVGKFQALSSNGQQLRAYNSERIIPEAHCRYRDCALHNAGYVGCSCCAIIPVGGLNNHLQGLNWIPNYVCPGNYLLVTGNNPHTDTDTHFGPAAHLFIIKMEENTGDIVGVITITNDVPGYTHPGGIQICGKYVVIPMEGDGFGKIIFYEISGQQGSLHLSKHPTEIITNDVSCGAAAMARLTSGYYLAAYWNNGLVLYRSIDKNIDKGFFEVGRINPNDIINPHGAWAGYFQPQQSPQNINFINGSNGKLYLLTTDNTGSWSPVFKGTDFAALFEIALPEEITEHSLEGFSMTYIAEKRFVCHRNADFKAAAGIHIPNQNTLCLYGAYHWLKNWCCCCNQEYISVMKFS